MIKIVYAAAADFDDPRSGTDLCSRCHFDELCRDGQLDIAAISVSPSQIDPARSSGTRVATFAADLSNQPGARRRLQLKLALLASGGILFQSGFRSAAARSALRVALAAGPDVLLVDHITTLANISLWQLARLRRRGRTKVVMISHDISSDLLRDRARLQSSKLKRFAIRLHALHCHLYETAIFALANHVIFISAADRDEFRTVARSKSEALCPVIDLPTDRHDPPAAGPADPYLVFVGSPSFFPNAFALDWITRRLAPELLSRMPELRILLIGRGTDRPDPDRPANVAGLGFVADDRLHHLLRHSVGSLSPVIHGSGIKIKVLEAIAAGCAIFASRQSLRGFDFMGLEPMLDIDDPASSAARICAIVSDPKRFAAYVEHIDTRWQDYKRSHQGCLASRLKQVADRANPASSPARSAN